LVVFRGASGGPSMPVRTSTRTTTTLSPDWTIRAGDITRPAVTLPFAWNELAQLRYFSGTATYGRTFDRPSESRAAGARTYIDFGDAPGLGRNPLPAATLRENSSAALAAPPIREAATI